MIAALWKRLLHYYLDRRGMHVFTAWLEKNGMTVARQGQLTSFDALLARHADTRIRTVIDVGASDGHWTQEVLPVFPDADYCLIEAIRPSYEEKLSRLCREKPNVQVAFAACGAAPGETRFKHDPQNPFGGIALDETAPDVNAITVPVTTIDREVADRNLQGPFFIKLDTHGYETQILEGAVATLPQTELLLIETYNFPMLNGGLRFPQLCQHLEDRGFRCLDLCDPVYRPSDGALWSADLLFAPTSSALFSDTSFFGTSS